MSGTSVDAIDAVLVRIDGNARDSARIEKLALRQLRSRIRAQASARGVDASSSIRNGSSRAIDEICHLDFVLGELFAAAANRLHRRCRHEERRRRSHRRRRPDDLASSAPDAEPSTADVRGSMSRS